MNLKNQRRSCLISPGGTMICMFLSILWLCQRVIPMANLCNMLPVSLKNEQSFKLYLKRLKAFVYENKFYDFAELEVLVAK
jgi:hypothetical protein